ncbi:MAG: hypothetical protein AABZ47_02250, partial [Planctomycetota bacterium]
MQNSESGSAKARQAGFRFVGSMTRPIRIDYFPVACCRLKALRMASFILRAAWIEVLSGCFPI